MVHTYYFSASNTTEKIVKAVADNLGQEVLHHNLTPSRIARIVNPAKDDIVIFAAEYLSLPLKNSKKSAERVKNVWRLSFMAIVIMTMLLLNFVTY